MATYAARDFAHRLGGSPSDWGLRADQVVTIDENDRIWVDGHTLGHVNETEREYLEKPDRALALINKDRARKAMRPLDPKAAGWTDKDLIKEARRLGYEPNAGNGGRSPLWPVLASFLGRGAGAAAGGLLGVVGTVATPKEEQEKGLARGVVIGGSIGAAVGAAAGAPTGWRARAAAGALAGNAVGAATLFFLPWTWANIIATVMTPVGTYVAVRAPSRQENPASRWPWIGAGLAALLLAGGGIAYARLRKKKAVPSPEEAVLEAREILGPVASADDVADMAYAAAYPECPTVLDPNDPKHQGCIAAWMALKKMAAPKGPAPSKPARGPAAETERWLDGLTSQQRTELRDIIGTSYYDPISSAAWAGDDDATVKAVLRLKADTERLLAENPIAAASRYSQLKALLGPKLDTFLEMAERFEAQA